MLKRTKISRLISVILLAVLIYSFAGCTPAAQGPGDGTTAAPVNLSGETVSPEKLAGMIGMTRAEVLEQLGITEADMTTDIDFASVSITYEYAGVSFDELHLNFARDGDAPHCGRLMGFKYQARYADMPDTAATDALAVGTQLLSAHGASLDKTESNQKMITDLSKETIVQEIANDLDGWENADFWDITASAGANIKDYMQICPDFVIESPRGPAYNVVYKQHYYIDFAITHFPSVKTTTLALYYGLDTYRNAGEMLPGEGSVTPSTGS